MRKTRTVPRRRGPPLGGEVAVRAARPCFSASFCSCPHQRRRTQWSLPPTTALLATSRCRLPAGTPRHGRKPERLPCAARPRLRRRHRSIGPCCTTRTLTLTLTLTLSLSLSLTLTLTLTLSLTLTLTLTRTRPTLHYIAYPGFRCATGATNALGDALGVKPVG